VISPSIQVVLFDLDGVLRRFDPAHGAAIEYRYGLAPGALARAVFDASLIRAAVTGQLSRAGWIAAAGRAAGSVEAAHAFLGYRGRVDEEAAALAAALRAEGLVVGLLTNATNTLDEELTAVGLGGSFDAVFNSSALGVAKPDPRIYARALAALGVPAGAVAFTDDRPENVEAARRAGWRAAVFEGAGAWRRALRGWGVACGSC